MAKDDFSLEVEYPASKYPVMDDNIIRAVRKKARSTGIDVKTAKNRRPKRDLIFGFATEKARDNAKLRVQRLKLPGVTVKVWDD